MNSLPDRLSSRLVQNSNAYSVSLSALSAVARDFSVESGFNRRLSSLWPFAQSSRHGWRIGEGGSQSGRFVRQSASERFGGTLSAFLGDSTKLEHQNVFFSSQDIDVTDWFFSRQVG